ncbi:uncharacterized protein NMK_2494 [Novimethylophilus kurashikiensis]|uniref:Uncharacterized protein n=1 Tax=Novimethylophilus kurashikiensis TaxID=1825523 RepID=A0A2R5FDE8_9PROT|nr:hypothetical protein [Novimethylophilus kurashikiensis]GBG14893.1 uncharacterized protein NMK_2494 [Novimethylophilus kurashikiensis]
MDLKTANRIVKALDVHKNQRAAAKALKMAQSTFNGKLKKAREVLAEAGVPHAVAPVATGGRKPIDERIAEHVEVAENLASGEATGAAKEAILENRIRTLENLVRTYKDQALSEQAVREKIFGIAAYKPTIPDWLSLPKSTKVRALHAAPGVPFLFGSDWHWGEVVNPTEIGGVNEYNLVIARSRLRTLIESTIELLTKHMVNPQYPGIIFALGGDMVSGNIHEELSETNDMPIMPVVLDLIDHLIAAINRLKEVFGRVFLPCVAGNHGRLHKKMRAKESNFSSYDWLIYQTLDRYFAEDEDVIFYIPDGSDALISVYGHKYLITHGNQFRGGDGMIGPLGPITRGDHKKRSRNAQIGQEYDTLVIGHFHQLLQMRRIIMNGSLIGYNEYAHANNFGYEPPQQALWITHPERGITFSMPVHLGEEPVQKDNDEPWVAFFEAKKVA